MQNFLTRAVWMASILSIPLVSGIPGPIRESVCDVANVKVLEIDSVSDSAKIEVACAGPDETDEALIFDLSVAASSEPQAAHVVINGHSDLYPTDRATTRVVSLPATDRFSFSHQVGLQITSSVDAPYVADGSSPQAVTKDAVLTIAFTITAIDQRPVPHLRFGLLLDLTSSPKLRSLSWNDAADWIGVEDLKNTIHPDFLSNDIVDEDLIVPEMGVDNETSLLDELEALQLLEVKAASIQAEIVAKKLTIATDLKAQREKLRLMHLLTECDGVVCAAKAIAHRVCDKLGITLEPKYTALQRFKGQQAISLDEKNAAFATTTSIQASRIHVFQTKNGTTSAIHSAHLVHPSETLTRALEIIAGLLGLTAVIALVKRICMSDRTRAERAADREERKTARAYRRAARRAEMRKRWNNFTSALNCFRMRYNDSPLYGDYEDKRALILQDALLEQDLDFAEKGQIMEAEIRELRHAHAIVSSLVHHDGSGETLRRFDVHDPPPSLVPLPSYRSRAASTWTLPSYCSESLPDYTSRPDAAITESAASIRSSRSNSSSSEYMPSDSSDTSLSAGRDVAAGPVLPGGGRNRYTPTSSVIEISMRGSEDTLRTGGRSQS